MSVWPAWEVREHENATSWYYAHPAFEDGARADVLAVVEEGPARRARPPRPRGIEGRWLVAEEYRAAQGDGVDPMLAVMCAACRSRRKSLRLIAGVRGAEFLTLRHARC